MINSLFEEVIRWENLNNLIKHDDDDGYLPYYSDAQVIMKELNIVPIYSRDGSSFGIMLEDEQIEKIIMRLSIKYLNKKHDFESDCPGGNCSCSCHLHPPCFHCMEHDVCLVCDEPEDSHK